ncbi:right-handed parallel beta-helix repeat-containing protein [Mongoliitalea lutea]|uniref:Por secretion system C-terminal sorting domain-containing protein n=1 Tax=Mongoliitalea lutea TaxID=849756 RepID=A0A8J3CZP6_9BACT|nr:right-handed parallel beta-helix repeat-containing protein [Mongoliitalea lutea]GHB49768.1 hypothetical protein GCM10008106_33210 [Mongoliitalea lutea]
MGQIAKLYLVYLIFFQLLVNNHAFSKTIVISPTEDQTVIIENNQASPINPGDTVYLTSGRYKQLLIRNINGSKESPIVITNKGGVVKISDGPNYGVSMRNSSYIIFEGSPSLEKPIQIFNITNGNGISVEDRSSDITIRNIEINNVSKSGIMAKSDPTCNLNSPDRNNFKLENLIITNCLIFNTGDEGIYVGSAFYSGQRLNCNGQPITKLPHIIENVEISYNTIHSTGKDALQVSSTPVNCKVHNNRIYNDSVNEILNQMTGILIGGGCKCEIYNNLLADGKGSGIEILGKPGSLIFNNIIHNAGITFLPNLPPNNFPKHGIYVNNVLNEPDFHIHIFNNTIINTKTNGITLDSKLNTPSAIKNNIIINPGAFPLTRNRSFIFSNFDQKSVTLLSNLLTLSENDLFDNLSEFMFYPAINSPQINSGTNIDFFSFDFDFYNKLRPKNGKIDIGAVEFQEDVIISRENLHIKIFPNPTSDFTSIEIEQSEENPIEIEIINSLGQSIRGPFYFKDSFVNYTINIQDLRGGIYIILVKSQHGKTSKVLIKK